MCFAPQLTELNWSHLARAATAGVTLAGALELTSTADSSARLVANVSSQETGTGEVLMYTAVTADYDRQREVGAAVNGSWPASGEGWRSVLLVCLADR